MAQYGSDSQPIELGDISSPVTLTDLFCEENPTQMVEDYEPHQPSSDEEERAQTPPMDPEEPFSREPSPKLTHKRVAAKSLKSLKKPRTRDDWAERDQPDLADYFQDFDTPDAKRIVICRTYASYLSALQPKKRKVVKKTNKSSR